MPEARERKKADKIKEKSDRRVSPVKKTMRRRMTAKLQKELMEQKQGRESDSGLDMTPETQAAEQAERKIYTAADSLREHTRCRFQVHFPPSAETAEEAAAHSASPCIPGGQGGRAAQCTGTDPGKAR